MIHPTNVKKPCFKICKLPIIKLFAQEIKILLKQSMNKEVNWYDGLFGIFLFIMKYFFGSTYVFLKLLFMKRTIIHDFEHWKLINRVIIISTPKYERKYVCRKMLHIS